MSASCPLFLPRLWELRSLRAATRSIFLLFFLIFFISATALSGCASKVSTGIHKPLPDDALQEMHPSGLGLSPKAEYFYYYLLLSEGMRDNDPQVIRIALRRLLELEPELPVFQDSVTILMGYGEYKAARLAALEGLRRFPRDNVLTLLLAEASSEDGDTREAVRILETHLREVPGDVAAVQELARFYLLRNNLPKASALLDSIPGQRLSPQVILLRARILNGTGNPRAAKALLRKCLRQAAAFPPIWLELGLACERLNQREEALAAYRQAAKLESGNLKVWLRMIQLHLASGQTLEAGKVLREAPPSGAFLLQAALCFSEAGRHEEAENLLSEAGRLGASAGETALYLSFLRQAATGDPLAAASPLDDVPPEHPLYLEALLRKIRLLLAGRDFSGAAETAAANRKRQPERKPLWSLEAYALFQLEGRRKAESLLAEGLRQYPEDEELLFALGQIQDESGDKDEALRTMERIILHHPDNIQALNYVGYTLADQNKDLARALRLITAALEHAPETEYIVDSLAWVQYRLGRYQEAWATIRRCLSLGASDSVVWEHYAEIALALGKRDEAIRGYTEAVSRNPDNADALRTKLTALTGSP
ncbi:MAG: tetratricopeptide repeat protein [Desulfovibrio sp.]|jgi:predicted Zn-dependent protease|nr:tetratricopeptide repeat protein [Desulfovibrio sp.]